MVTAPQFTELDRMGNSRNGRGGARVRYFFLHTEEGNSSAESLASYLNNPAHDASYHYTCRDGVLCDVVDTDYASWSVGDANSYSINFCFAGSRANMTRAQWLARENDIAIAAYVAVQDSRKYGYSLAILGTGGKYNPGSTGIADHQYVTDVIGWGTHTDVGPGFPVDVLAKYVALYSGGAVVNTAVTTDTGDDDMSWLDLQVKNWKGVLLGWKDVLWWLDKNTAESKDQLMGPDEKGWPMLGKSTVDPSRNNTLVEAVADIRDRLAKLETAITPTDKS